MFLTEFKKSSTPVSPTCAIRRTETRVIDIVAVIVVVVVVVVVIVVVVVGGGKYHRLMTSIQTNTRTTLIAKEWIDGSKKYHRRFHFSNEETRIESKSSFCEKKMDCNIFLFSCWRVRCMRLLK